MVRSRSMGESTHWPRPILLCLLLAGAGSLAGCDSSPTPPASITTTSTATGTVGLVLHVVPATNLHNGQVVLVSVSGFPPGKAFLSECASAADVNPIGCGAQLATQPFVVIEHGGGTERFTVTDHAPGAPLTSQPSVLCTTQCVLVATSGEKPVGRKAHCNREACLWVGTPT
jgi:hypothetical protein